MQQKWVTKLLGYSFIIEYKKGRENVVGDALSRQGEKEEQEGLLGILLVQQPDSCLFFISHCNSALDQDVGSMFLISFPSPTWIEELKASYADDPGVQKIFQSIQDGTASTGKFSVTNGLLLYKGWIYLGDKCKLKGKVLELVHDSPLGGHSGFLKTLHRAKKDWFWWGMKKVLKDYIKCCEVCQ